METALGIIQSWINNSKYKVQVIPRNNMSNKCESILGITEYSTLGTIVNHTGGLSVANGVIRHFGGSNIFNLSIGDINALKDKKPSRMKDVLIVADDIYGGIFAININLNIGTIGKMLYLPPESYAWENLNVGHSAFVEWSMSERVQIFYKKFEHIPVEKGIAFNKVINYLPPLWSKDLKSGEFDYTIIDSIKMIKARSEILEQLT